MAKSSGRGGAHAVDARTPDGGAVQTVRVHGEDVRVDRVTSDVPAVEARSRFGGVDLPAVAGGVLAALGATLLLSALLSGAGGAAYESGVRDEQALSVAGLVAGVVTLALAALLGGWVTGRMSRYDGARNGLLTAAGLLLLTALVGALGAWAGSRVDAVGDAGLPSGVDTGTATVAAAVAAAVALLLALGAGAYGGRLGARWHRGPDDALVQTRPGGLRAASGTTPQHVQPYPTEDDR